MERLYTKGGNKTKYQVLLYYRYIAIEDPETFAKEHLAFCGSLNLKGRILVATEGINETLSGIIEEAEKYMEAIQTDERPEDTFFKIDPAKEIAFHKVFVRPRSELVALSLEGDVDSLGTTGRYSEPAEFKEALLDEDAVVIDARNDYEYDLGHFRGAVCPGTRNLRGLPQWIHENKEQLVNKKTITYCAGRIRCEKPSSWLLGEGFEDVARLRGSIADYGKSPETRSEPWGGEMYIFDDRINVEVSHVDKRVIGKDWSNRTPCEHYINCANPECNHQILTSEENGHKHSGGCSLEYSQHPANRYVKEHNLAEAEATERLALLETVGV